MNEIARAKAEKNNDSRLWSTEDALEDVLQRLRAGQIKPDQLAIHWFENLPGGGYRHGYTVAGVTFQQHMALLHVGLDRTMKAWVE